MVTYDELANTNLSALDTVATDFEQLVRTWEYDSDFRSGVTTPLAASGWSGPASQAAAGELTAARTQIDAAFNETSAIAKALRDAHDQFVSCQNTLRQIQQDAQGQGLIISADGSQVTWTTPANLPHNAGIREDYQQSMSQAADAIAQRLKSVLQQATDADQTAAAALAADTGTNQQSFNAAPVGGIPEEQAAQAAALAKQGNNLTNAQLTQLDAMLKAHANDPAFTTAFYNDLGPQETLKFWGQLSEGSTGTTQQDPHRLAILKDMQAQLGTSLACATNTQTWPHLSDQWEAGLRAAGAQKIQLTNDPDQFNYQPYGYQILGSILRTGNYDPHFLDPIAEHVTQLTEKNPEMWIQNSPMTGLGISTNFLGGGAGFNPVTGVLEGLGHSPAAATDFFHNPETLYNADGTPTGQTAANGYLNWLTDPSKNQFYPDSDLRDMNARGASMSFESTALGHALQAGTTGVAWDAPNGTPIPQHTAAESDIMSQVVKTFGSNPSLIHGGGAPFASMNTSLAHMTASYMGDVQRSLAASPQEAGLLPTYGSTANLDPAATSQLLETLGRNPDAYGILTQAQQGYTAAEIHNVVAQHPTGDFGQMTEQLKIPASAGAYVSGILNSGKANEIMSQHLSSDAAYNASVDKWASWANTAYGLTGGTYVGKVPVVGGIANGQVSNLITQIANGYHHDTVGAAVNDITKVNYNAMSTTGGTAASAAQSALQGSNFTPYQIQTIAASVSTASQGSFDGAEGFNATDHGGWTVS